tara:strand:+ start:8222 stop:8611 length:390 start_codon:yes stop_codon:yes gene_type:complete
MVDVFILGGLKVSLEQVNSWLKKDDHPEYDFLTDINFIYFLNGLVINFRGKKVDSVAPVEKKIDNNLILKKLKIAFTLDSNSMLEIFKLADFEISKHELSAFFRKPGHKNYRECKDQILRNFLNGLQKK